MNSKATSNVKVTGAYSSFANITLDKLNAVLDKVEPKKCSSSPPRLKSFIEAYGPSPTSKPLPDLKLSFYPLMSKGLIIGVSPYRYIVKEKPTIGNQPWLAIFLVEKCLLCWFKIQS